MITNPDNNVDIGNDDRDDDGNVGNDNDDMIPKTLNEGLFLRLAS